MKMNPVSHEICDEAWKKAWQTAKDSMNYKLQWSLWADDLLSSGITWERVIRHLEVKYNDTGI